MLLLLQSICHYLYSIECQKIKSNSWYLPVFNFGHSCSGMNVFDVAMWRLSMWQLSMWRCDGGYSRGNFWDYPLSYQCDDFQFADERTGIRIFITTMICILMRVWAHFAWNIFSCKDRKALPTRSSTLCGTSRRDVRSGKSEARWTDSIIDYPVKPANAKAKSQWHFTKICEYLR